MAAAEVDRRIRDDPSLYDLLLGSIYFRQIGDQSSALSLLGRVSVKGCFDVAYNQIQSYCLVGDFSSALKVVQDIIAASISPQKEGAEVCSPEQAEYLHDVESVLGALAPLSRSAASSIPLGMRLGAYVNLDGNVSMGCPCLFDDRTRSIRTSRAWFDPVARCWVDIKSGLAIRELFQPRHDFRGFIGDLAPVRLSGQLLSAGDLAGAEVVNGVAVYVEVNPHFGHFVTQSASYANAIPYAESLVGGKAGTVTVLCGGAMPEWGQILLQQGCSAQLEFREIDKTKPLIAEQLVVHPQTWVEWHYCHRDHARIFGRIAKNMLRGQKNPGGSEDSRKALVYFSRSRLCDGLRSSVNEEDLELRLEAMGFETLHPQLLSLREICSVVNSARLIAGSCGSAMHNVLFSAEGPPPATLNFAHFLPAANFTMIESCCDISTNYYTLSAREVSDGGRNLLAFDVDQCVASAAKALDLLG
ncbi:MAG: glycosyltransferase 61 family protein [Synechococcus sp.]